MPRGKKMQTPSKQPKISSMTHEEEEEMQHDISKLRDQVQQISLSQRVTRNEMEDKMDALKKSMEAKMDSLKNGMEAKMNGFKNGMEANMDGIEGNMEDLKNGLKEDMEGLLWNQLTKR